MATVEPRGAVPVSPSAPPNLLGLALIAKDEEDTLPNLLASIRGAFDRIVYVDTGSKDKSQTIFEEWAAAEVAEGRLGSYLSDSFPWCEDFGAARRYAHSKLATQVECWADCDDVIVGAEKLRGLAQQMLEQGLGALIFTYNYAQDPQGNCICTLKRERLVAAGSAKWTGRVHEAQEITGGAAEVPASEVEWVHRKPPSHAPGDRNLKLLRLWEKEEPENPRVVGYLGTEELTRGKPKRAVKWFRRYLKLKTGWDEERAQIARKLSVALMALGRHDEAMQHAFEAIQLLPEWTDSYLTLAEAHYRKGEVGKAAHWANEVLRRGMPASLLILNPLDYSIQPKVILAGCLAASDQLDQAIALTEEVFRVVPGHPALAEPYAKWLGVRKHSAGAQTVIRLAQTLEEHDENLKALAVLEAAPHFCTDHPQVVAWRSKLRERIAELTNPAAYFEHYTTGGSKPEDMVEDHMAVGDALPRCAFLLSGLKEQAGVA
jgi:tetratricopeptide (TPR) repeat protein